MHQGSRDGDFLAHAARERREPSVKHVVESEQLRELRGPSVRVRDVVQPREEPEVSAQGHALVERRLIGDEPASRAHAVRVPFH